MTVTKSLGSRLTPSNDGEEKLLRSTQNSDSEGHYKYNQDQCREVKIKNNNYACTQNCESDISPQHYIDYVLYSSSLQSCTYVHALLCCCTAEHCWDGQVWLTGVVTIQGLSDERFNNTFLYLQYIAIYHNNAMHWCNAISTKQTILYGTHWYIVCFFLFWCCCHFWSAVNVSTVLTGHWETL